MGFYSEGGCRNALSFKGIKDVYNIQVLFLGTGFLPAAGLDPVLI